MVLILVHNISTMVHTFLIMDHMLLIMIHSLLKIVHTLLRYLKMDKKQGIFFHILLTMLHSLLRFLKFLSFLPKLLVLSICHTYHHLKIVIFYFHLYSYLSYHPNFIFYQTIPYKVPFLTTFIAYYYS